MSALSRDLVIHPVDRRNHRSGARILGLTVWFPRSTGGIPGGDA